MMISFAFEHILKLTHYVLRESLFNPFFLVAVSAILILERLIPAELGQPIFSRSFWNDFVWVFLSLFFLGSVIALYGRGIDWLYERFLKSCAWNMVRNWPFAVRFGLGVFVGDFLAWFQHWLKHKVPLFWRFHAVHHSQTQLNVFTDYRFHFLEYIISRPIVLIPLMLLNINDAKITAWGTFAAWQARFYHANIRTNLGWLRYFFVTPQSHRVHHSVEKKHADLNFGVVFSLWDRLFGTRYPVADEYPKTGISDPQFPDETAAIHPAQVVWTPLRQLIYPFRKQP